MLGAYLKAYSRCIDRLYGMTREESPVEAVMDALELLLPVNSFSVDLVHQGTGAMTHEGERYLGQVPEMPELVPLLVKDHPGVLWTLKHGAPKAQTLSQFVTQRRMRELQVYNHILKAHSFRDQAVTLVPVPEGTLAFVINRDRVFTQEEFLMLEQIQPHVRRIFSRSPLFMKLPGKTQLSGREGEVLQWISRGKGDEEIALILGISRRTVHDHVRQVLAKLGVENRTAAAAAVLSGDFDEGK